MAEGKNKASIWLNGTLVTLFVAGIGITLWNLGHGIAEIGSGAPHPEPTPTPTPEPNPAPTAKVEAPPAPKVETPTAVATTPAPAPTETAPASGTTPAPAETTPPPADQKQAETPPPVDSKPDTGEKKPTDTTPAPKNEEPPANKPVENKTADPIKDGAAAGEKVAGGKGTPTATPEAPKDPVKPPAEAAPAPAPEVPKLAGPVEVVVQPGQGVISMWQDLGVKTLATLRDLGLSDDQIRSYFPDGSPMDRLMEAQLSDASGDTSHAFANATHKLAAEHGDWNASEGKSRRIDLDTKMSVGPDGTVTRTAPGGTVEPLYDGAAKSYAPFYTGGDMTGGTKAAPVAQVETPAAPTAAPDAIVDGYAYNTKMFNADGSVTYMLLDGTLYTIEPGPSTKGPQ